MIQEKSDIPVNFLKDFATNLIEQGREKVLKEREKKREAENMIDVAIVNRFKGGEERAFFELVERHKEAVSSIVFKFIRDRHETEDVTQEVFIAVYKSLKGFRERSRFFTWLYSVVMNVCTYYRRDVLKKAQKTISLDSLSAYMSIPDTKLNPVKIFENKDSMEKVNEAINKLPEELKSALILREVEEFSYEEIAKIMKVSVGTVKSRIHNARVFIGRQIGKDIC